MRTTPTRTRTTRTRTRTRTTPSAASKAGERALARLIEPFGLAQFVAEYWERRPLYLSRAAAGRFDDLLSAADVERLICSGGLRYPAFRIVKTGARFGVRDFAADVPWRPDPFTGLVDVQRVLAEFEAGATIVLQGLHLYWEPVAVLCRELETALDEAIQANAYFTPRGSQALPVHHDTHDVFVLQVAGEKRWLVYEPALELPLKSQRYSTELGEPADPVLDLTLAAGDTLYLPRGWLHEALTSGSDSLHLTIGANVYTWLDALRAALEECADDVDFRRAVAVDGDVPALLLQRLGRRLGDEAVRERKHARLRRRRRPILGGQLSQLRALDRVSAHTEIERRSTAIAEVAQRDGAVMLAFDGKTLSFPARVRAEVEFVVTAIGPFRTTDLPGKLDDSSRLVLVRRLVREGLLRIGWTESPDGAPRA
jgi:hypothetical protein